MKSKRKSDVSGFTLVEMAVVLVIVGLMLGGMLMPLAAQMDMKRMSEARNTLEEIKEALLGYALIHGRLPCPDTDGNGTDDGCPNTNTTASSGGNLPWVDLGVPAADPWGGHYQYRLNNAFSSTFTITSSGSGAGILRVCGESSCGTSEANNVPAVIYSAGKNGAVQPPAGTDELENTTLRAHAKFDRTFVNHAFATASAANGEFDDIMSWISPAILMNRMVSAGKLP